ncbi:MAG TPA: hypothetical protein VGP43_01370 [Chitinophagaceae bacterium]|nr:hypothetical protein [Chitinophagaceae bacterium]
MNEEKNKQDQPEDDRPPIDNIEKSAEGASISSEESETVAEENIQHLTPNIQHNKEIMEVHHHGHVHENKKWKEYFFQFLMLFLAVFLGFLAEYQLEHVVENNREEQYIKSFIEDLKADTAKINRILELSTWQQNNFDSLMGILKAPGFSETPDKADNYVGNIFSLYLFNHTDRTLQQLKNAGGLRLIRNQQASDSIMQYDAMVKKISEQSMDLYNANQGSTSIALQVFDANSPTNPFINRSLVPKPGKVRLISNESVKIDELFNQVLSFKIASVIYCDFLRELNKYATRQINFLKEAYDLQ